MKKPGLFIIAAFVLGFVSGVFVWQRWRVDRLVAENLQLRDRANQVAALTEENALLTGEQVDPNELKRLRDGQAELVRLRGQVAQLRRETQEAKAAAATAARTKPAAITEQQQTPPSEPPVDSFTNNVTANVGWNHTLITGGWRSPTGNRLFVFLRPVSGAGPNAVLVASQIAEVPEHLLFQLGLAEFKSDASNDANNVFTPEQSERLAKAMERTEGVKLLSAPQVITPSGRPAQVSVTEAHSLPKGESYTTGPTINVVPTIAPDGQSVELVVDAKLDLPRAQP